MSQATKQERDTDAPRRWTWVEARAWNERMLAALGSGVTGGKWYSLMDKVSRVEVLEAAWERVAANHGAAGVDRQSVEAFAAHRERYLAELSEALATGRYVPQPVRRTYIPKRSGGQRPLGIPTVKDRVVQGALKLVLEPIFEREFVAESYGFRPGRGCKDALREVEGLLKAGHVWVVDADIRSYFEAIPKDALLGRVGEKVSDGRVLSLVEGFLNQDILEGLERWTPLSGTPQGAVLTPRTQKVTSCLIARLRSIVRVLCLTCAVNGNIDMTHGAIDRLAEGRTPQRRPWVAGTRAERRGDLCVAGKSVRHVPASGLPLRPGGAVANGPGAIDGAFGGGDVQVAAEPGEGRAGAGRGRPDDAQRDGGAGAVRLSCRAWRPWRVAAPPARSSRSNTPLTYREAASWSRHTRSWCPSRHVPPAPDPG